jgi:putative membrane protein
MVALAAFPAPDPGFTLSALGFVAAGVCCGTLSGLTPGLHANNFALLMAAVAPTVPGPPALVGAAMLAAGVTHTFLDVVPALALGVPDAAMAAVALPGHRLVLEGRGREALRLSALGSVLAVLFAVPLAVPMTELMIRAYGHIDANLPLALGAVAAILILTERGLREKVGGLLAFVASALLGYALLRIFEAPLEAPLDAGGLLMPLFGGLFGAPVLLDAIGGGGIPPQGESDVRSSRRSVGVTAFLGTGAGAIVGYIPGVSSAIAATAVLPAIPDGDGSGGESDGGSGGDGGDGAREFLIATSAVNTANTIFALFALIALGSPRTGVLVALEEAEVPLDLPVLLSAVVIAAGVGFVLVVSVGDRYLDVVGRTDYTLLSVAILVLLIGLSYAFAGPFGIGAFAAATVVGLIPPRFGARRVHLMGVLIGPLIIG